VLEVKKVCDIDNIKIEKKTGGSIEDTSMIEGVLVDKEIVHSSMPKKMEKASILLLDSALEIKDLEGDAKINIDSPEKMQAFIDREENALKQMVEKVTVTYKMIWW